MLAQGSQIRPPVPEVNSHLRRSLESINTVESHSNGLASNENPPLAETIVRFLEKFFFIFYIGNNRNPHITDKNGPLKSVGAGGTVSHIHYITSHEYPCQTVHNEVVRFQLDKL